ncbi:MAG: dienelactone hydrolase family protein, partial [Limisphaerales bacterium]
MCARFLLLLLSVLAGSSSVHTAAAGPLPGTEPLNAQGDLSAQMVAGIDNFLEHETQQSIALRAPFWKRDFSSPARYETSIETNRNRLKQIIGAVEPRVRFSDLELVATTGRESKVAETQSYTVVAIRWPALEGINGEGLWLRPKGRSAGAVICLPDADQTPEQLCGIAAGILGEAQFARTFAEQGFDVFIPVLIHRNDTHSGSEELGRYTNQPHREWIYRQAYEMGFHIIGYEVQKVLALVDWLETRGEHRIGVAGYGEGGLIALYSAALDPRIQATLVSGYFGPREKLWEEPIYRNIFGLLEAFGDAEIASMIAPRRLIVEYSEAPRVSGPPAPRAGRSGAAPGKISTPERHAVDEEINRAREFFPATFPVDFEFVHGQEGTKVPPGSAPSVRMLVEKLGGTYSSSRGQPATAAAAIDADERQGRQLIEMVDYTQHQITRSERERNSIFWSAVSTMDAEQWVAARPAHKEKFWSDLIGRFPEPQKVRNARSRQIYDEPKWIGYEVTLNVWPGVFAWGILCVPKD